MPKNRVQFFAKDAACPLSTLSLQDDFEPIGAVLQKRSMPQTVIILI